MEEFNKAEEKEEIKIAEKTNDTEKELNKKKKINIGNIISTAVIVILIILIIIVAVPKIFGVQFRAVQTPSMEPELPVGALLIIVPESYETIKIGDDITYVADKEKTVVTHRVISKQTIGEKETITTKGIANDVPDTAILYGNVLGKVRYSIPVIGYSAIWLDSLFGKIVTISAIILIFIISVLLGKPKKKRKQKRTGVKI